MSNCWYCGEEISEQNKSTEHIIPNTIYGKLRSKKILCKTCNEEELSHLDVILSESLNFVTALIDHKKDRNRKSKKLLMEDSETGKKYVLGQGFRAKEYSPDITKKINTDETIEIRFKGDEKNYKKFIESQKRKYPNRKIDVTNFSIDEHRSQLEDTFNLSIQD